MSKKDDSPDPEWMYTFESAKHGEIVLLCKPALSSTKIERCQFDCLQAELTDPILIGRKPDSEEMRSIFELVLR